MEFDDQREHYAGIGATVSQLVGEMIQLRALAPDDSPTMEEALRDTADAVADVEGVEDLPAVALNLFRACSAAGMRPSVQDSGGGVVLADVGRGVQVLNELKGDRAAALEVRAAAAAISVFVDLAYTEVQKHCAHGSKEDLDDAVRSALLIAENSARRTGDEVRLAAATEALHGMLAVLGHVSESEAAQDTDEKLEH